MSALPLLLVLAASPEPGPNYVPAPDPAEVAYAQLHELWRRPALDGSTYERAMQEIIGCGPAVIPALVDLLERGEAIDAAAAVNLIGMMAMNTRDVDMAAPVLIGLLQDNSMHVRVSATTTLMSLDVDLQDVPPILVDKVVKNITVEELRQPASMLLGQIGQPSLAPLLAVAREPGDKGLWAVATLARLGEAARPALPALVETLKSPEERVRFFGSASLFRIGLTPEDGYALEPLVHCLSDESPMVRERAVKLLGQLGAAALPAVPDLKRALQDRDGKVALAAAGALEQIATGMGTKVE